MQNVNTRIISDRPHLLQLDDLDTQSATEYDYKMLVEWRRITPHMHRNVYDDDPQLVYDIPH